MKRVIIIIVFMVPLMVLAQGNLYQRYASQAGLTVAQVDGFRLADTVRVDVVLVVADDEAAWQRLSRELGVRDADGVTSWLADVDAPARRTAWSGKPVLRVVASPARRSVGFYRLDTEAQYDALIDYQINQSLKNKKKK